MGRLKAPFHYGTITNNPLAAGGTTLSSTDIADLPAVASPEIMAIILDPTGVGGDPEIVHITAHTAASTNATITRGEEGTTGREHISGTTWLHGPTTQDYDDPTPALALYPLLGV